MDQCSFGNRNLMIGIITCLLLAGVPSAMAADETTAQPPVGGTITLISFPQGAAVYLNGEYRGVTPAKLQNVPPGDYLINVSLAGYNNETFTTTIYHWQHPGNWREPRESISRCCSLPGGPSSKVVPDRLPLTPTRAKHPSRSTGIRWKDSRGPGCAHPEFRPGRYPYRNGRTCGISPVYQDRHGRQEPGGPGRGRFPGKEPDHHRHTDCHHKPRGTGPACTPDGNRSSRPCRPCSGVPPFLKVS